MTIGQDRTPKPKKAPTPHANSNQNDNDLYLDSGSKVEGDSKSGVVICSWETVGYNIATQDSKSML